MLSMWYPFSNHMWSTCNSGIHEVYQSKVVDSNRGPIKAANSPSNVSTTFQTIHSPHLMTGKLQKP
jgi:hypothetical protein